MAARVDILSRPRKLSIVGLLLAGTVLGAAGCAQQRTEGYYDPPVESTVTDAQYQGSGAGYRTVLRAPSQVQIALKPDQKKTQAQSGQPAQGGNVTEDGQAVPEGTESASASSAGSAPAPVTAPAGGATQSATANSLVPQPQTYMGTLPCFCLLYTSDAADE